MHNILKKLLVASLLVWAMSFYVYSEYFSPHANPNQSKTEAHDNYYVDYYWPGYQNNDYYRYYQPYNYSYYPYSSYYDYSNRDKNRDDDRKNCEDRCRDYYDDQKDRCDDTCRNRYDNHYSDYYYPYSQNNRYYPRDDNSLRQTQYQYQSGGGRQEQYQEQSISL